MSKRLIHDVAYAFACTVTEQVGHRFKNAERAAFFDLMYQGGKAMIEAYDAQLGRQERRTRPLDNPSDN